MGIASSFLPSISDFDSFKDRAEGIGLQAVQLAPHHWQLIGGAHIVNYYPSVGTIHVNGTNKIIVGSAEDALQLARKDRKAPSVELPVPVESSKAEYSEYRKDVASQNRGYGFGGPTKEEAIQAKKDSRDSATTEILALTKKGLRIEMLTPYQYRINGVLDLYPTNRKYHHIRFNRRGIFSGDIERFVKRALEGVFTAPSGGTQKKVLGSAEEALNLARKSQAAEPSAKKRVVIAKSKKDEYSEYTQEVLSDKNEYSKFYTHEVLSLMKKGYRVDVIAQSQYRIEGKLDIFPKSKQYHIITSNLRGTVYGSIEDFVIKTIGRKSQFSTSASNYRPASTPTPELAPRRQYSTVPSPRVGTAW